ncbi:MAG: hypothetical protein A3J28_09660 [Acidobacteria bacterium RIFCSPLOWO2_12_FULL_60_22]|nr:MAG: hypothetical protein A3J28_09660 [Acidobacteria bacterium RIFCSPLOWO2_12_FULL_60_22]
MFRYGSRAGLAVIVTMGVLACTESLRAADDRGTVEGVVKSSAGRPLPGAFVKLKNAQRRLTFLVITQEQGRYTAADLPPGTYTAQAVGNGFESSWSAPVEVAAGKVAKLDLSLTNKMGPIMPASWPGRVPEAAKVNMSLPEGAGKQIVSTRCTGCHDLDDHPVLRTRATRNRWQNTVNSMRQNIRNQGQKDLTEEEAKTLVDYLATNFKPEMDYDDNSRLPRTLLQGKARKYRVVQYNIENDEAEPHDIAVDPYGNGWANQRTGGKLGRLDGKTLEYSEISLPAGKAGIARPGNLQIDSKGIAWLPDASADRRWLSLDTKTGEFKSYPFPTTIRGGPNGNSMAVHPDGSIWSSGPGAARRLDPATGEFKEYDSPTWLKTKRNPGGYGIAIAGDGKVWFAESGADQMAKVDPATGIVEEFKIPVAGRVLPRRMGPDGEGNIWVGLWYAGKLMKIDAKSNEMTSYNPPTPTSGAYSVSVDKKNNLVYVSFQQVDKIARFNHKTGEWVEYPLPESESDTRRIEVDKTNPKRIWWSGTITSRMGFLDILE